MAKKSQRKNRIRITTKPKDHTLYWVYGYVDNTGEYNFETTTNFAHSKKLARELVIKDGFDYAYIFYGDENGAFTDIDPAETYYPTTFKQ